MSQLTEACLKGEWERGRDLQLKLTSLIRSLFIETNPIPVKTAAALMGKCTGELRLPLTPMAEGNLQKLKQAMVEFGLIKQPHRIGKTNEI
jgi:4-hydroxy-tetrahydrodipicolinate synthase